MSSLRILDLPQALDLALPWPDVYFSPGYGAALRHSDDAEWAVAVWTPGPIVYPLLKRRIDPELGGTEGLWDAVSPYGYAGIYIPEGVGVDEVRAFRDALVPALVDRGCVAEFLRLSDLVHGRDALLSAGVVRGRSPTWSADAASVRASFWLTALTIHSKTRT